MALRNKVSLLLITSALLAGCSVKTKEISLEEQTELLKKDQGSLFVELEKISEPLTLHRAIARAIKYNLDYKVASLEKEIQDKQTEINQYSALPDIELSGNINSRSNLRASSSQSATTGLQSLESSFSSERTTRSMALQSSWNMIESGLALSQAQNTSDETKIAHERSRKVLQTITREVHILFWKAASAQILEKEIDALVAKSNESIKRLEQAEKQGIVPKKNALQQRLGLLKSINQLLETKESLSSAKYELSSLINIDPSSDFTLSINENDFYIGTPLVNHTPKNLADIALIYRPESREEVLKNRIAERAKTQEIISSIPGLEIFASRQYDSNSFLLNPSWAEVSASISQSLVDLITLPKRLDNVELQKKASDIRRRSLFTAIITQTYIAHNAYAVSANLYQAQKDLYSLENEIFKDATSKRSIDVLSEMEYTEIKIDTLLGKISYYNSFIEMWYDYIMLIDTLGIDPLPYGINKNMSIEELETVIKNRHKNIAGTKISEILDTINSQKLQSKESKAQNKNTEDSI